MGLELASRGAGGNRASSNGRLDQPNLEFITSTSQVRWKWNLGNSDNFTVTDTRRCIDDALYKMIK